MSFPEFIEQLTIGNLTLRVGVHYQVIHSFTDDKKIVHPIGENWFYEGFLKPKMYPGYVLHVCAADKASEKIVVRMNWGNGGQEAVMSQFDTYICTPEVKVEELLEQLTSDGLNLFNHYANSVAYLSGQSGDELLKNIDSAISNASCAAGRSDEEIYIKAETDLCKLRSELNLAITKSLQGRTLWK